MKESTAVATSSDIHQESTKTNKAKTTHKIGKAQKGSHTAQSKGPASRILLQINQNEKQKQKSAFVDGYDVEADDQYASPTSDETGTDDQLVRNTVDSIKVDIFDLANEEERKDKDQSLHYKNAIQVKTPAKEPEQNATQPQSMQQEKSRSEGELTHGSEEFNEIKKDQGELFDFMDNLRGYAKQIKKKMDI